ncbi:hypothetical protein PPERSA_10987 [Pseudocohnilembus persalinus]|uniref:Cache domain-containing protein n=1 Tax=Pseudocohnilembus persalinus TaxID=266149 RepID=A0A0V0QC92_PSEPJ|nr:hypothetical protein PPERSA_10987 [Pseudocohnilembus persalinus]|eukprot:KRW99868.1 hypothetical protein PPERSA_10987 [Pseudocohnilembus persalinus]
MMFQEEEEDEEDEYQYEYENDENDENDFENNSQNIYEDAFQEEEYEEYDDQDDEYYQQEGEQLENSYYGTQNIDEFSQNQRLYNQNQNQGYLTEETNDSQRGSKILEIQVSENRKRKNNQAKSCCYTFNPSQKLTRQLNIALGHIFISIFFAVAIIILGNIYLTKYLIKKSYVDALEQQTEITMKKGSLIVKNLEQNLFQQVSNQLQTVQTTFQTQLNIDSYYGSSFYNQQFPYSLKNNQYFLINENVNSSIEAENEKWSQQLKQKFYQNTDITFQTFQYAAFDNADKQPTSNNYLKAVENAQYILNYQESDPFLGQECIVLSQVIKDKQKNFVGIIGTYILTSQLQKIIDIENLNLYEYILIADNSGNLFLNPFDNNKQKIYDLNELQISEQQWKNIINQDSDQMKTLTNSNEQKFYITSSSLSTIPDKNLYVIIFQYETDAQNQLDLINQQINDIFQIKQYYSLIIIVLTSAFITVGSYYYIYNTVKPFQKLTAAAKYLGGNIEQLRNNRNALNNKKYLDLEYLTAEENIRALIDKYYKIRKGIKNHDRKLNKIENKENPFYHLIEQNQEQTEDNRVKEPLFSDLLIELYDLDLKEAIELTEKLHKQQEENNQNIYLENEYNNNNDVETVQKVIDLFQISLEQNDDILRQIGEDIKNHQEEQLKQFEQHGKNSQNNFVPQKNYKLIAKYLKQGQNAILQHILKGTQLEIKQN